LSETERILERILTQRRDLTREKLLALIEDKKKQAGNLLSDEGATRLVAQDLLVEMEAKRMAEIRIVDLVTGLNDVTITGRVVVVWPAQEFRKSDGSTGKILRFLLADRTGKIHCAAWNSKAEGLEREGLMQGKIVKIAHGYTREGLAGSVELHCGDRGDIIISPTEAGDADYPKFEEFFINIAGVTLDKKEVNVIGVVKSEPKLFTFQRQDGEGYVLRTRIADITGNIAVVVWNEKVGEIRDLKRDDVLQVINGRVKKDLSGFSEIHVDKRSKVEIFKERPTYLQAPASRFTKIAALKPAMRGIDLLVRVAGVGEQRELKRATGELTHVGRLLVNDDTGLTRISLWDEHAKLLEHVKEGDVLLIEEASTRERGGVISINVGKTASVTVNPQVTDSEKPAPPKATRIKDLPQASGMVIVEGTLTETPILREVVSESGEKIEVASSRIRDETGEAHVSFWRTLARRAVEAQPKMRIRLVGVLFRVGMNGKVELSSDPLCKLEIMPKTEDQLSSTEEVKRLAELRQGESATIQAMILEVSEKSFMYASCSNCMGRVDFQDDEITCSSCGIVKDITPQLLLQLKIDDGTAFVDATAESPNAEILLKKDIDVLWSRLREQKVSKVSLPIEVTGKLIGMRVEASGIMEHDTKTGKPKFLVNRLRLIT
jgi:replication factor A1